MPNRRHLPLLLLLSACGPDADGLERRAVDALRSEIPALQERYLAENGRYASHIRELTGGADTLASGVRVIIQGGGGRKGWSASNSHAAVPGAACAVVVGQPSRIPNLRGGVTPTAPRRGHLHRLRPVEEARRDREARAVRGGALTERLHAESAESAE